MPMSPNTASRAGTMPNPTGWHKLPVVANQQDEAWFNPAYYMGLF